MMEDKQSCMRSGKSNLRGSARRIDDYDLLLVLTLDFDNREEFESHHYAFHVSEDDFDGILGRLRAEKIPYGSGPGSQEDMEINHWNGGSGLYFKDPDGHLFELLTRPS